VTISKETKEKIAKRILGCFYEDPDDCADDWTLREDAHGDVILNLSVREDVLHAHALEETDFAGYLTGGAGPDELDALLDVERWDRRNITEFFRDKSGDRDMTEDAAMSLWDWLAVPDRIDPPGSPRVHTVEEAVLYEYLDFTDGWCAGRGVEFEFFIDSDGTALTADFRSGGDLDWSFVRVDRIPEGKEMETLDKLGFVPYPS
jgi:hypothetical protein